jgi:hypothetical protein
LQAKVSAFVTCEAQERWVARVFLKGAQVWDAASHEIDGSLGSP